jgi:hypothetical protein
MSDITTRAGKGEPLTHNEVDANFTNLNSDKYEAGDSPSFGSVTVTGTVDGRDVAADGSKLDGIESGATADQTAGEIKTAYESNADTNAFTDAEKSKLSGVEAGAEVNAVDSVNTQTGAVVLDADDISDAVTSNKFTTAADISKLAGIEAGADVTDTANVTAAGALMDSEVTNLAAVKSFDPADYVGQTTTTGSAELPSGTTAERDGTPSAGYIRFNSTDNTFEGYDGSAWGSIGGAGGGLFKGENGEVGSSAGDIFRVNEQTLNTDVTIDADENANATGPLTVASGITLTVTSGGNLSIV